MKKPFTTLLKLSLSLTMVVNLASAQNIDSKIEKLSYSVTHKVGEHFGGGIVFFVYSNGTHGLIASIADQDKGLRWYEGANFVTGDGVGAGKKNTGIILKYDGPIPDITLAAKLCSEYAVQVDGVKYDDWYLPSKLELSLLYMKRQQVGGFSYNYYWSSTVYKDDVTWFQDFGNSRQDINISMPNSIRAIRSF